VFATDPTTRQKVDDGVMRDGSNLSGVSAQCCWCAMDQPTLNQCTLVASGSVTMASVGELGANGVEALAGSMSSLTISHDANAMRSLSLEESEQIKSLLKKGLSSSTTGGTGKNGARGATSSSVDLLDKSEDFENSAKSLEVIRPNLLQGVHLCFNHEAGSLIPLAIR
jgi:hypothetical protein